ncbi:MAG TPA: ABC transporter ATP-binding protein [bacterium]|jgi:putative ABC transport system ATP-binding protein|nr:ABC transporter ATP-binding protein [bacterium]MDX9806684.1 ABC transporter ATP-binding protein [bacterium]HNW15715.1 ABC transporter ATP-binding protein [bacterium]HNZ54020.1 ABC transporter ATP-binding protein [bacterium]HOG44412.1 ABC transporter ATP-binding protein [bacterium]
MDIVLKGISKSYKNAAGESFAVIKDLSLDLKSGAVLRLKGPSGSGKTTLMNILSGLILPDSGIVKAGSFEITAMNETRRDRFRAENAGYIFQTFNLLSPFSVIENIYAPLAFAGKLPERFEEKAIEVLNEVGLAGLEKRKIYHLSVGQRQRVCVARVLFSEPKIILADEPTASLDTESARTVYRSIEKCRSNGSTVIFASHDRIFDDFKSDLVFDLETGRVS